MASSVNILIVDDLPENLIALEALIRRDHLTVHAASSGDDALSLLLEHDFALALLDVQMPGMNGFELAELMRGTERTRRIPIVFVSAAGRELNHAFRGYEAGAVDFLHKPLDAYAVNSKVAVFVDMYRQRSEMRRQVEALELARREQQALLERLNAAQQELEHAVKMRDDFMSIVAHELRTPLNTLFLESQLRRMQLDRGNMAAFDPARLDAMFARDDRQIRNMVRLIEDMMDVSRIRSGTLSVRPVKIELSLLLQRVVDDLAQQAAAVGSTITLQAPEPVDGWWDEFRIEQVAVNLLTNALRYGSGKPVEVSLSPAPDGAHIEVRDHGIGISQEDQKRIFRQFERAGGGRSADGLGLGLFITQQLVEAHGGSIKVYSEPGNGSVFILHLPHAAAPA
ncbi:hybrid sensor histidine kinase/response regulator [Noviherbaspirillum suwonense]|uniref:histidine kinase n=1 Tax=Noviherbaspirillum suwonense TaxID=1224511 RepID=A0ABY1Q154_9BURK|nr:hybrid sensor histidine kinase/response regulator [Noviherbaspirillum suwonense]SMP56005.1 Signal transduction histidine kinase [Noviherbaspirillum suwonense]